MTTDDNTNSLYNVCLLYVRHCSDNFLSVTSLYPNSRVLRYGTYFFPHFRSEEKRLGTFSSLLIFRQLVSVRNRF